MVLCYLCVFVLYTYRHEHDHIILISVVTLNHYNFLMILCIFIISCVHMHDKVKKAGGVSFNSTVPLTKCSEKMAQLILHEYSIRHSAVPCVQDKRSSHNSVSYIIEVLQNILAGCPSKSSVSSSSVVFYCRTGF